MPLFLLSYLVIYGGMNVYALLKARAALDLSLRHVLPLLIFMSGMIITPIIVRLAERNGYPSAALFLSYVGYFWLGFVFLFVSCALALDAYRCLARLAAISLGRELLPGQISAHTAFFLPLTAAMVIGCYGIFEALDIRTEYLVIPTNKLSPTAGRIRIVQISDVHLGLLVRETRLKKILAAVKEANPDLLVSTGDLVDGQMNDLGKLTRLLQEIKPPAGKYAITGNHEYYAGLDQALTFIREAGFTLLSGKAEPAARGRIIIAGVNDETARQMQPDHFPDEEEILRDIPEGIFTVLLKHRPSFNTGALRRPDLQLSGHTHRGQIFPFSLVTWLFYPVSTGYSVPIAGSALYVSRGTGTWGPPIRFLSPPEVTVIDLVPTVAY